jgi:methyl-accepting chemotaxis protein
MNLRFTIKQKLAAAFGLLIVLMLAAASVGVVEMNRMNDAEAKMLAGPAAQLHRSQTLSTTLLQLVRAEKNLVLSDSAAESQTQQELAERAKNRFQAVLDEALEQASPVARPKWEALRDDWRTFLGIDEQLR